MFTLAIENAKGNRLRLTQNPNYTLVSVDGLAPVKANINTAVNANFDGSTFKSSRLQNRNIVIMLAVEGAVETNRIELYKFIKVKQEITVYVTNGTRDVFIKGYVENMQVGIFAEKQMVQISVICPNPYFSNANENHEDFSNIQGLFEFPFDIDENGISFGEIVTDVEVNIQNLGDVPTGMIIEFRAIGAVVDPAIYNTGTGQFMKLITTMSDGDVIQINTNKGEKGVLKISDGTVSNILNVLDPSSTWLELEPVDNIMMFTASVGAINLQCSVYHDFKYEGV
jgi:hypothetical protein